MVGIRLIHVERKLGVDASHFRFFSVTSTLLIRVPSCANAMSLSDCVIHI